ncbi:sensor histidine kinase [Nocardiopsis sp. RV163]|uniref:sensor histidine kinase n=1 Tax=Nocardiopsis sp. RV163 TaxID=1661388 RepID=UPI00064BFE58|nr:sensor histidine kinase [Nocardiopsis sp. RV163]
MGEAGPTGGTVLWLLRAILHTAFFALLGIGALQTATDGLAAPADRWAAVFGALVLAAVYAAGPLMRHRARSRATALGWLAAVTALWALVLLTGPDFSWVAFPLFFLHLHLLRRRHAVVAVTVITAAVVAAQALHLGALTVPVVLGPVIGALTSVVIALGYAALYNESEQRRRLIDDLTRTRGDLAASQHRAGVLAERERLAREIHDTLAQGLSSIVLLLRSAEGATPGVTGPARERIAEARATAAENLEEARRFVRDLTPPSLEKGSLVEALRRVCERAAREGGPESVLRVDGDLVPLPRDYEVALLRAAQASLANTVAHAGATRAVVTLGFLDEEVTLDVVDDGRGFAAEPTVPRPDGTGFGLAALRERMTALGGHLEVESAPGEGTAVAARLPLARGAAANGEGTKDGTDEQT